MPKREAPSKNGTPGGTAGREWRIFSRIHLRPGTLRGGDENPQGESSGKLYPLDGGSFPWIGR